MNRTRDLHHPRLLIFWIDTLLGVFLCTSFALTAALLARAWPHLLVLLFLFATAVGLVATAWGFVAAMLGLGSGALVFCLTLFVPVGRFAISSADTRVGLFGVVPCATLAGCVFERPRGKSWDIRNGDESC